MVGTKALIDWVDEKELKSSYHNLGIEQIIGFPHYSNLVSAKSNPVEGGRRV